MYVGDERIMSANAHYLVGKAGPQVHHNCERYTFGDAASDGVNEQITHVECERRLNQFHSVLVCGNAGYKNEGG